MLMVYHKITHWAAAGMQLDLRTCVLSSENLSSRRFARQKQRRLHFHKEKIVMDRMDTHVKVVSWLYIVLGALGLVTALCIFGLFFGIGLITDDRVAFSVLTITALFVAGLLLTTSLPGMIAGFGLLRYRQWARILALVLAVLNLPMLPIGTLLGVYSIWVLLDDDSIPLFNQATLAAPSA